MQSHSLPRTLNGNDFRLPKFGLVSDPYLESLWLFEMWNDIVSHRPLSKQCGIFYWLGIRFSFALQLWRLPNNHKLKSHLGARFEWQTYYYL